jgi:XTP/dITP diphosphohydrolase
VVIIATRNPHKLTEVQALPAAEGMKLEPLDVLGQPPAVDETGVSFEENAAIKAVRYSLWVKREADIDAAVVAEDSGLQIEALFGWPGIESARLAPTDDERIAMVLSRLADGVRREAQFAAVTAVAVGGHFVGTFRGIANGLIIAAPRGSNGFGYDPIFEDPATGLTYAEMTIAEKNERSHRAEAWTKALRHIQAYHLFPS